MSHLGGMIKLCALESLECPDNRMTIRILTHLAEIQLGNKLLVAYRRGV